MLSSQTLLISRGGSHLRRLMALYALLEGRISVSAPLVHMRRLISLYAHTHYWQQIEPLSFVPD